MSYRGEHDFLLENTDYTDYKGVDFSKYSIEELKKLWRKTLKAGMHGLCFSLYEDGQEPGDIITEAQVERRIEIIKPYTKWVRSFSCTEGNEYIPRIAHKHGLKTMVGAWIDCLNAWSDKEPDHHIESPHNSAEIDRAVQLAQQYPDIVKILAVGNEAMVKWATSYYVQPDVILKWVKHVQELKNKGELSKDLWITSSDNFASWGGGENQYHVKALEELIAAVDYLSVHTYPMHDTHYNPSFWGVFEQENERTHLEKIDAAMLRAKNYAIAQRDSVARYIKSLGLDKPIHIGETGWASASNGLYGSDGSKATDEYKEALYYNHMRDWTNQQGMSCFYFEAFDEPWKDAHNPGGSENHFGLFTVDGKAKYVLWDLVDQQVFKGLTRDGNPIIKTYNGDKEMLLKQVLSPPSKGKIIVN